MPLCRDFVTPPTTAGATRDGSAVLGFEEALNNTVVSFSSSSSLLPESELLLLLLLLLLDDEPCCSTVALGKDVAFRDLQTAKRASK
jgi:hypothetical protein